MLRRRRTSLPEEPAINLTPLIDVVFVILFTFIVIAPLLEVDSVALASGSQEVSRHTAPESASCITLHVFANDDLVLNNQPITLEDLPYYLRVAKERFPESRPQLFHDRKATFGTYQSVKNAFEAAGFPSLDVILKPD